MQRQRAVGRRQDALDALPRPCACNGAPDVSLKRTPEESVAVAGVVAISAEASEAVGWVAIVPHTPRPPSISVDKLLSRHQALISLSTLRRVDTLLPPSNALPSASR